MATTPIIPIPRPPLDREALAARSVPAPASGDYEVVGRVNPTSILPPAPASGQFEVAGRVNLNTPDPNAQAVDPNISFWDRYVANPWQQGMVNAGSLQTMADYAAGKLDASQFAQMLLDTQDQLRAIPQSPEDVAQAQRVQKLEGWDQVGAVVSDPGLIARTVVSSTPASLASAGTGLVTGFLAGGPAGAGVGGLVGAGAGAGVTSAMMEYRASLMDYLTEQGLTTDVFTLTEALKNPAIMGPANEFALKRAAAIGTLDAVSMGIAGKIAGPVMKAGAPLTDRLGATGGKIVGNALGGGAELAAQGGSGAYGEFLAQGLSDGRISNWGDVAMEGIAEVPGAITETGSNIIRDLGTKPAPTVPPPAAPPPAAPPTTILPPQAPIQPAPGAATPAVSFGQVNNVTPTADYTVVGIDPAFAAAPPPSPATAAATNPAPTSPVVAAAPPLPPETVDPADLPPEAPVAPPVSTDPSIGSSPQKEPAPNLSIESPPPAPVSAAPATPGRTSADPAFQQSRVTTPDKSMEFDTQFEVVDASQLQTAEGQDQPRDRAGRAASDAQIRDIASKLDPLDLLNSRNTDSGSPIVDENGVVLSGNGRTAAIRLAAEQFPDKYAAYRAELERAGFDLTGMQTPVLVRRARGITPDQRRTLTTRSNVDSKQRMSAPELARMEADYISTDMLAGFNSDVEDGVTAAANRDFVRQFVANTPEAERNSLITSDGQLSTDGAARVSNAIFARAYGDPKLIDRVTETNSDPAITNALLGAAAEWGKMRDSAPEFDITSDLVAALQLINDARAKGMTPNDMLRQQDAFRQISPRVAQIASLFYGKDGKKLAAWRDIRDRLRSYAQSGAASANAAGDMLGNRPGPDETLARIAGQAGVTAEPPAPAAPAPAPAPASAPSDGTLFGNETLATKPLSGKAPPPDDGLFAQPARAETPAPSAPATEEWTRERIKTEQQRLDTELIETDPNGKLRRALEAAVVGSPLEYSTAPDGSVTATKADNIRDAVALGRQDIVDLMLAAAEAKVADLREEAAADMPENLRDRVKERLSEHLDLLQQLRDAADGKPKATKPKLVDPKQQDHVSERFVAADILTEEEQKILARADKIDPIAADVLSEFENNARRVAQAINDAGYSANEIVQAGRDIDPNHPALGMAQDLWRQINNMGELIAALEQFDVDGEEDALIDALDLARDALEEFEAINYPINPAAAVAGTWDPATVVTTMDPGDVFPDPGQTRNIDMDNKGKPYLSQAEADALVQKWRDAAQEVGRRAKGGNKNKIVLSLFDYTGTWSQPWRDAGYTVIQHDIKAGANVLVDTWIYDQLEEARQAGMEVVGVLAATPCTTFAASGARWWSSLHNKDSVEALVKVFGPWATVTGAKSPLEYNKQLVEATRDLIAAANPTRFHVMENPIGRIQTENNLPEPTARFQPHNFGDAYTKRTQLWGDFNADMPTANVDPVEGSKMQSKLRGDDPMGKAERSKTPEGFAYAFFIANEPEAQAILSGAAAAPVETQAAAKSAAAPMQDAGEDVPYVSRVVQKPLGVVQTGTMHGAGQLTVSADRKPVGVLRPKTEDVSRTVGPSIYREAWRAAGLDPDEGNLLPPKQKINVLRRLLGTVFGFRDIQLQGIGVQQAVAQMMNAYRNVRFMMHVLGLPVKGVSLDGRVQLNLQNEGRRYFGVYDPGEKSIGLPGQSNSFAHEWMHALDHYLSDIIAGRADELLSQVTREDGLDPSQSLQAAWINLIHQMFFDEAALAARALDLEREAGQVYKNGPNKGKPTVKALEAQRKLDELRRGSTRLQIQNTAYRTNSADFGDESYWASVHEMLARAFEAYVGHKVHNAGGTNEFITKGEAAYLSDADMRLAMTFPKAEERLKIFRAFDEIFDHLRRDMVLGTGPAAERPADVDIFDPQHWNKMYLTQTLDEGVLDAAKAEANAVKNLAKSLLTNPIGTLKAGVSELALNLGIKSDRPGSQRLADTLDYVRGMVFSVRGAVNPIIRRNRGRGEKLLRDAVSGFMTQLGENRFQQRTFENDTRQTTQQDMARLESAMRANGFKGLKFTDEENAIVRELLLGQKPPGATKELRAVASVIRDLFDKAHAAAKAAGMDIGYITEQGYLSRVVNRFSVDKDQAGFLRQAGKLYQIVFDEMVGDPDFKSTQLIALANQVDKGLGNTTGQNRFSAEIKALRKAAKTLAAANRALAAVEATPMASSKAIATAEKNVADATAALDKAFAELRDALRDPFAELSARDWLTRINIGDSMTYSAGHGPGARFNKRRTLPAEADTLMKDFYQTDVLQLTTSYVGSMNSRTAYLRRAGNPSGETRIENVVARKDARARIARDPARYRLDTEEGRRNIINDLANPAKDNILELRLRSAEQLGATGGDVIYVRNAVEMIAGRADKNVGWRSDLANRTSAVIAVATQILLLTRAALTSLSEPLTMYLRTGSAKATLGTFLTYVSEANRFSQSTKERAAIARAIGVVTSPLYDAVLASASQHEQGSKTHTLLSKMNDANLLNQLTNAQRRAAMNGGFIWMQELAKSHAEALRQGGQEARAALVESEFKQLGVREEDIPAFMDWLLQAPTLPTLNELETAPGRIFSEAIYRFVGTVIQDPQRADKPMAATTPLGRVVFGLTSFIYTFTANVHAAAVTRLISTRRTVLDAGGTQTQAAITAAGVTVNRLVIGFALLFVGQFAATVFRESVFNGEQWEKHRKEGDLQDWLIKLTWSRVGVLGVGDILMNALTGLKYERDFANLFTGPGVAYVSGNIQNMIRVFDKDMNSPNTNTAEREAAKSFYRLAIAAPLNFLMAVAGNAPVLNVARWGAMSYLSSNTAASDFADKVVGPKNSSR